MHAVEQSAYKCYKS